MKRIFLVLLALSLLSGASNNVVSVFDYGAIPDFNGSTGTDNRLPFKRALTAASAAGGGIVSVPCGKYMVGQDGTSTTNFSISIPTNVTLAGQGECTQIYGNIGTGGNFTHHYLIGAAGTYPDFPGLGTPPQNYPNTRIAINPANVGDTTITATVVGAFSNFVAGTDWVEVTEGPSPKWDYKVSRYRVIAVDGTQTIITTDRPLDMPFNNDSALGIGVFRWAPVENAWVKDLVLTGNNNCYDFDWQQTVGGGLINVVHDFPWNSTDLRTTFAQPEANDTHRWTMQGNRFKRGVFTGLNRGEHAVVDNNRFEAYGAGPGTWEFGQGSNYNKITRNYIFGAIIPAGELGVFGGGATWWEEYTDNYIAISSSASNSSAAPAAFYSKGAFGIRFSRNTIVGCGNSCIVAIVGSAYGLNQPAMWNEIDGNHIFIDTNYAGVGPIINVDAYPAIQHSRVTGTRFAAPSAVTTFIKVGSTLGNYNDKRTLTIWDNHRGWNYGAAQGSATVSDDDASGAACSLPLAGSVMGTHSYKCIVKLSFSANVWSTAGSIESFDRFDRLLPTNVFPSGTALYTPHEAVVTVAGTQGTLNSGSTTATTTIGLPTVTFSSMTGMNVGSYITIAGATSSNSNNGSSSVFRVLACGTSTLTCTLDGNASATLSGVAVAYSAPTIQTACAAPVANVAACAAVDVAGTVTCINNMRTAFVAAGCIQAP